jgi:hypothetical protein
MPRPILHIGFHKTATSWFQSAVYPRATSHRLIDRDLVRSVFMDSDAFDFDPVAARARLKDGDGLAPPLLCEEELSGVLHIGAASTFIAKEVANRLHATLPDAQVVIFVRSQVDAAASWYLQYLKEGGTASARRYLFPDEYLFPGRLMLFKTPRFDFSQLDYAGLVGIYDQLFGCENVHVFAYEDLPDDGAAVLAGLQRRTGLTLADDDGPAGRINPAYRRGIIPIARAANLFTARQVANKRTLLHLPFWFRIRWEALEKLNSLPLFGGRPRAEKLIGADACRWIEQRFAKSNAWLAERMGRDLAALGYGIGPGDPVAPPKRSSALRWTRK